MATSNRNQTRWNLHILFLRNECGLILPFIYKIAMHNLNRSVWSNQRGPGEKQIVKVWFCFIIVLFYAFCCKSSKYFLPLLAGRSLWLRKCVFIRNSVSWPEASRCFCSLKVVSQHHLLFTLCLLRPFLTLWRHFSLYNVTKQTYMRWLKTSYRKHVSKSKCLYELCLEVPRTHRAFWTRC